MTGHNVRGEKPRPQWQMAAVHHRASRHGCLSSAASTFPSRANSLQRPALAGAARGANEAVRPPSVRQILRARFLIGKTRVERLAGHRSVIFPSGWHRQNNTRTSWIGKPCNTTSCAAGSKGISLQFANAILKFFRQTIQNEWETFRSQVSDNFRVITHDKFRVLG